MLDLVPPKKMLDAYKKKEKDWKNYEKDFLDVIAEREIEKIAIETLDSGCFLCSEANSHYCHRRLVA